MTAADDSAELRKSFDRLIKAIVSRRFHYGEIVVLAQELRDKHAGDRVVTQRTERLGPGCV